MKTTAAEHGVREEVDNKDDTGYGYDGYRRCTIGRLRPRCLRYGQHDGL